MPSIPFPPDTPNRRPPKAVSYCVECDALPGECGHNGARYLDPIVYERVEAEEGRPAMWRVPDHERERVDNPPRTWATPAQRAQSSDPAHNPFTCAGCGAPLNTVARVRGYTYCSKQCREGGRSPSS